MEGFLYAEVYLICIIVVWLCRYWSVRLSSHSAPERWLHVALVGFLACFLCNFFFTLVDRILPVSFITLYADWLFKTLYHMALCFGVFAWCGYADTECRGRLFATRKRVMLCGLSLTIPAALLISNLWTHHIFEIGKNGYVRHSLFHLEMGMLVAVTAVFAVRLLRICAGESDPIRRGHMRLASSFPLSLAIAWALSRLGEAFPVICVCITVELLCLFMGTSTRQISMDKLTQINNRQNLLGFLDYKLLNHTEKVFLYMMDLDYFKTINDTYGHLEGDDALVRASKALKTACGGFKRRPYIARYGGDEFIVVVESSKAEAEALMERIHQALDELNRQNPRPYTLAFSIGMAEYLPGMKASDLIEAADSALYEVKRTRHIERR